MNEQYELPEGWRWVRLGEVCEVFSGTSAPQDKRYFTDGKYPFVRVQDLGRYGRTDNLIEIKDYINDIAIKELNLVKAEKGIILFPKSGAAIATNNRAILGIDAYIVSHLAAVRANYGIVDLYFVYYWLCNINMGDYMENIGYPSLKLSKIKQIPIPLPPLSVQRRIVAELKEKMADVEKLRLSIEKQLETINALPQAILRKAFRGEL
ncbi:MAG: restriction endonuclease subunit S [candidate division WOR-3 bacterium]